MVTVITDECIAAAVCGLMLVAGLVGVGVGMYAQSARDRRREARVNAEVQGLCRELPPYQRKPGEPFGEILRGNARHERWRV